MDIHHIRYFLAVCDTLNFSRAAEKCNVTQPALSRSIQQLEEEVGGLLFRRERNQTRVTELGLLMRPRLQNILDGLSDVRSQARRFMTLEQADLALGVMCTLGPMRFTAMLGHFRRKYPGIALKLIEGTPASLTEKLETGDIDIAIMAQASAYHERLETLELYSERFVVAFPAGHRLGHSSRIPISELDGENYLERLNCEYRGQIEGVMKERGCAVTTVYESEREDWIQNMVAGGHGITTLPEFSATIPGLQTRPLAQPDVRRTICLVKMAGRRHSPAVATFIKALRAIDWKRGADDLNQHAA